jgi:hypothetical protein
MEKKEPLYFSMSLYTTPSRTLYNARETNRPSFFFSFLLFLYPRCSFLFFSSSTSIQKNSKQKKQGHLMESPPDQIKSSRLCGLKQSKHLTY